MADTKSANECTNPFVKIQGGPFQLGLPERDALPDEQPPRNVTISSFQVQQHEVSLGEFKADKVLGAVLSGCKGTTPDAFLLQVKPGESKNALQKRAQQIAGQLQCNSDAPLMRQPKIDIPTVDSWGSRINHRGDAFPV